MTQCEENKHFKQTSITLLSYARSFKVVYTADVSMMCRQIHPEDRDKLRVILCLDLHKMNREFKLKTLTYGTDSASFLVIRTIHQCAKDNTPSEELVTIIKKVFYVNDLIPRR